MPIGKRIRIITIQLPKKEYEGETATESLLRDELAFYRNKTLALEERLKRLEHHVINHRNLWHSTDMSPQEFLGMIHLYDFSNPYMMETATNEICGLLRHWVKNYNDDLLHQNVATLFDAIGSHINYIVRPNTFDAKSILYIIINNITLFRDDLHSQKHVVDCLKKIGANIRLTNCQKDTFILNYVKQFISQHYPLIGTYIIEQLS